MPSQVYQGLETFIPDGVFAATLVLHFLHKWRPLMRDIPCPATHSLLTYRFEGGIEYFVMHRNACITLL